MQFGWNQIWGMGAIVVGIICIVKRNVPIGFESRPPSFYAKGKWAILLGVITIFIGLFIGLEIPKQMQIDRCLNSGGSFDYKADKCIEGNSTNSRRVPKGSPLKEDKQKLIPNETSGPGRDKAAPGHRPSR